ncbi:hypothetical protein [Rhizobium mongolense]|uniref:hypothetical protein n=1 Tax=Rhizobium mongolense TaxID=57676 RepID=UPI0034A38192
MTEFVEDCDIDVGSLNEIIAAIRRGSRKQAFPIPIKLTPSRREVLALPVEQRRDMYQPRLRLRQAIEEAKRGYRLRKRIAELPWSAVEKRGGQIATHLRAIRKLMAQMPEQSDDIVGIWWGEALPELSAPLVSSAATIAELSDGKPLTRDKQESALDWFVRQLAQVFSEHLGQKARTSWDDYEEQHYGPFIAFVMEVGKEEGMEVKPSTIHRALPPKDGTMSRRGRKKPIGGS